MKNTIKKTIFKVVNNKILSNTFRSQSKGAKVLFYHGVEKKIKDPFVQSLHMPFKDFEKQIHYLKKEYEIISIEDIHDSIYDHRKLSNKHVALTFDDGYKNNLDIIFPFLSSLNIPFSIFISTKHIETGIRFPTFIIRAALKENLNSGFFLKSLEKDFKLDTLDNFKNTHNYIAKFIKASPQNKVNEITNEIYNLIPGNKWDEINEKYLSDQPMNWKDIITLNNAGVTIGSHCHDHFITNQNQALVDVKKQLEQSKLLIEQKCGSCDYFCFPNGGLKDISPQGYKEASNNFKLCFSTIPGELSDKYDRYYLPRYGAVSDYEHFKFNMKTSFLRNKVYKSNYKLFSNA